MNILMKHLGSSEFDTFCVYFKMKKHYNKAYLTQFDYTKMALARTKWFKNQILNILAN